MAHEACSYPIGKQARAGLRSPAPTQGSASPLSDVRFANHSFKQVLFNDSFELIRKAFVPHSTSFNHLCTRRNEIVLFHRSFQFITLHLQTTEF